MKLQIIWILVSLGVLFLVFGLGWYLSFQKKIFAWIDFLWSSSFIIVIAIYHWLQITYDLNFTLRLIDLMFMAWSLRLSFHLYQRIQKHGEDKRYVELKKKWKVWYGLKFFFLFEAEAFLTIILSIPLILTYNKETSILQYFSLILFIVSISGETLADYQLKQFIHKNKDKSKVCNVGLWKFSRHPNYFFEWMTWVSFAVYAFSSHEKWPGLIPMTIMYLLLTKVTGIPPAEQSSLNSKKENYIQYQKTTNAFFPWFPKILILCALMSTISSPTVLASGVPMNQQEKIKYVFDNLRADNMKILDDFYDKETTFIDPLGVHRGIGSVKKYYQNLYQNVKQIHFQYKDLVTSGNTHILIWTMTLSADGLNGGKPISLEGNSYIKFNDANLVTYHRDYFDMGEFIYEHIPVLGWTIKKVKNKLRGE